MQGNMESKGQQKHNRDNTRQKYKTSISEMLRPSIMYFLFLEQN